MELNKKRGSSYDSMKDLFDECFNMLNKKGNDYANEDIFANFKLSSNIAGITPQQSMMVLIGTKVARLRELLGKSKNAMNEPVRDTLKDLINYSALLYSYLNEKGEKS